MNKLYQKILIITALVSFLAGACKKDNDPEPEAPVVSQRAQMLQAHSWRYNSYFYLIKNDTAVPYYMPSCLLDDKLDYISGGNYVKDAGSVFCSGQSQKYDTLSWELLSSDTKLKITTKTATVTKDIISFKNDTLFTLELSPNGDSLAYIYLKY